MTEQFPSIKLPVHELSLLNICQMFCEYTNMCGVYQNVKDGGGHFITNKYSTYVNVHYGP